MMTNNFQPPRSKRAKQDDSIMATNNSSIVSKRSVERLYYPEPHFFRYFVKKPRRRSPLINRGYWLRMYVIEQFTKQFLEEEEEPSGKKKIVLNFGAGYDPLAFQWLSKYPDKCRNVTFVDIDYPELITRKLEVISQTPQLRDLLDAPIPIGGRDGAPPPPVDNRYLALGCDLADIERLEKILNEKIDIESCSILCVAEVSITYMDVDDADSLIRWASRYRDIRFCLLEQIIPNGGDHPFARKMVQHFNKLQTPLQSIQKYPNLEHQERRFSDAGWNFANARSLWDLWSDPSFISREQKTAINATEPFDEWEEFFLFASHYFCLMAAQPSKPKRDLDQTCSYLTSSNSLTSAPLVLHQKEQFKPLMKQFKVSSEPGGQRRFGAIMPISDYVLGHHGGLGGQRRLNTTEVYKSSSIPPIKSSLPPLEAEARMCHTITAFGEGYCLLIGGRTSPDRALSDCWLYTKPTWERAADAPVALYRHCATAISFHATYQGVLIYGGKTTAGEIENDWYLWDMIRGWAKVEVLGTKIQPRFGAVMTSSDDGNGILLGGMGDDGIILQEAWTWSLIDLETEPKVKLSEAIEDGLIEPTGDNLSIISRFGACLVWSSINLFLIGGISFRLLPQELEIIELDPRRASSEYYESAIKYAHRLTPSAIDLTMAEGDSLPLLVGHSVFSSKGALIIVAGGAVCFSFGTFWNQKVWTMQAQFSSGEEGPVWSLERNTEWRMLSAPPIPQQKTETDDQTTQSVTTLVNNADNIPTVGAIQRGRVETARHFDQIIDRSNPFVIEGLDLGSCVTEWTLDNLERKIGTGRPVVVHETSEEYLDFQKKNFRYVTKTFGAFAEQIRQGSRQYLRSLAAEKPSAKPAELGEDFPDLKPDFELPPELERVKMNAHSSPLRISGPVTMWLHYDVMANVLCQIQGYKRLILYPPSDVTFLAIQPGASSSSLNVFSPDTIIHHPRLQQAHPYETELSPGDILYIPPFWFHTASPKDNLSVSVNVFFRSFNQPGAYAAGRDVYGNRDLQAYENGRKDVERIVRSFAGLPADVGRFYLERLASELTERARIYGTKR